MRIDALSHTNPPLSVPEYPNTSDKQRFVSYFRVSTDRQGRSGLGLDAQREAVRQFVCSKNATVIVEFVEVESGRKQDRPKLQQAIAACRALKATLLIAKLDRLARNVSFVAGLMDGDTEFVAVDMPHASRFVLHIMAAVAEHERQIIGERTRVALQAAKARGVLLGVNGAVLAKIRKAEACNYAENIRPYIIMAIASGAQKTREIANWLNEKGLQSREGRTWHSGSVSRVLSRLELDPGNRHLRANG